jgi:hypothetical protein
MWNRIKILLLCVNEVSRSVLCSWEYLERAGWMTSSKERTAAVACEKHPPENKSFCFITHYVVIQVTSSREQPDHLEMNILDAETLASVGTYSRYKKGVCKTSIYPIMVT